MRIAPDTNVLVRLLVEDDEAQARAAEEALRQADAVVLSIVALCELVWVLTRAYGHSRETIGDALRRLAEVRNAIVDRAALAAGLAALDGGGDFADGVIAHEGRALGADAFLSFDRRAVRRLEAQGYAARMP